MMRLSETTRGIRFRATALVTVLLAAALLVGSFAITSVLRQRLEENLDSTLLSAASDRAELLADRADPQTLTDSRLEESLIWIGTGGGEQLAQGGRFIPLEGIPGLSLDVVGTVQTVDVLFEEVYDDAGGEENEIETEPLRLAIDAVVGGDETIYVVVGAELEIIDQPVSDVRFVLAVMAPLLLILVASFTWVTADRALRPVEAIRRGAASTSDHRTVAALTVRRPHRLAGRRRGREAVARSDRAVLRVAADVDACTTVGRLEGEIGHHGLERLRRAQHVAQLLGGGHNCRLHRAEQVACVVDDGRGCGGEDAACGAGRWRGRKRRYLLLL